MTILRFKVTAWMNLLLVLISILVITIHQWWRRNYLCLLYDLNYFARPNKVPAQKMKFSIKEFFSKYDQIRRKLRIWSHLLRKSLMENFIFCAVGTVYRFQFWPQWTSDWLIYTKSFQKIWVARSVQNNHSN